MPSKDKLPLQMELWIYISFFTLNKRKTFSYDTAHEISHIGAKHGYTSCV